MAFHTKYLKQFYEIVDSITNLHHDNSIDGVILGKCTNSLVTPKDLISIMDVWVNGIDKMIQLLRESETVQLQKKIDKLYSQRGITFSEFYYLTIPNLDEEQYNKTPAYIFTKTFSKELRNRRFHKLEYTAKSYKEFILSFDLVPTNYLKKESSFSVPTQTFFSHSYCVAKTRSGKTEMMKSIIHELILKKEKTTSLLILDPHGELSREVRRFSTLQDRLDDIVYLDPTIDSEHTPVFNPFQIERKDSSNLAYSTDAILEAFQQLLMDHTVTGNMKRLLRHLISAALHDDQATLMDLLSLLSGISRNRNQKNPTFYPHEEKLMNIGKRINDPLTRRFFEHGWKDVDARTVTAVIERLDSILSHPLVRNFIVGENTINLEEYLNNGKIVIVNLDFTKLGNIGSEAIGRLIISETQNISARRNRLSKSNRPNTIVFLDECQRFVNSTIERALSEFAKFGTYLFLAHQYAEQLDADMLKGILSNTDNKIVGRNSSATMSLISNDVGVSNKLLMDIKKYEFYFKSGDQESILFSSSSKLINGEDNKNYISEQLARKTLDQIMIKKYYREIKSNKDQISNISSSMTKEDNIGMEGSQFSIDISPDDF